LKGKETHETGGRTGCFGLSKSDQIHEAYCKFNAPCSYTFYSDFGCKGSVVAKGSDKTNYDPPITVASGWVGFMYQLRWSTVMVPDETIFAMK
ncbi:12400_t:CDS:2, partial [Racocetra persica]